MHVCEGVKEGQRPRDPAARLLVKTATGGTDK